MQQCMKLSLTNSPIDFIVLIENAHQSIDLLSSRANGAADGAGRPAARLCRLLVPRSRFQDVFKSLFE